MRALLFFSFLLLIQLPCLVSARTQNCNLKLNSSDVQLQWTAFKTPQKLGVSGHFKELGLNKEKTAKSLKDLLLGETFKIQTTSVETKNKDRDAKLTKFFFSHIPLITGNIAKVSKTHLLVELNMNGLKKAVPMQYEVVKNQFTASGVIDLFDFSLNKALLSINKACYELHEGKTWNDVELQLSFPLKCL